MEARDLRIGNLIQLYRKPEDKEKSIFKVDAIEDGFIALSDEFIVNTDTGIEPIPLTEEWLLKMGFDKNNSTYDKGLLSISMPSDDVLLWKNGRTYFNSWKILDAPKHLHQLQNLYYALTNTELTINL